MKINFTSAEEYELSGFQFDLSEDHEFVVFDLEATGPNAWEDSVTQFGAMRMDADKHKFQTTPLGDFADSYLWSSVKSVVELLMKNYRDPI